MFRVLKELKEELDHQGLQESLEKRVKLACLASQVCKAVHQSTLY